MYPFVLTLHIVLSTLLVLIILMQPGKGADVSSAFGGGASSQLFGSSGPGNFLTRGTGVVAFLFMVTSFTLASMSSEERKAGGGVEEELQKVLEEGQEGGGFGTKPTTPAPAPEAAPDEAPVPAQTPTPPDGTTPPAP